MATRVQKYTVTWNVMLRNKGDFAELQRRVRQALIQVTDTFTGIAAEEPVIVKADNEEGA